MKLLFREKFKVNAEKSNAQSLTCAQRCKKWDRRIASMFGLLAFFTLVAIVIYNSFRPSNACCGKPCENDTKAYRLQCSVNDCRVVCENIDENEDVVANHLKEALLGLQCNIIRLAIKTTIFKQSELNEGWLQDVDIKINETEITECTLSKINSKAFAGPPFNNNLKDLKLENLQIETLKQHSFLGLNSLSNLVLSHPSKTWKLEVDEEVLAGVSSSLQILRIDGFRLSSKDITNLFGKKASYMRNLETLVLSYNLVSELDEKSFINVPNVKGLHLQGMGLKVVHQNAFWAQNSITLLNLQDNSLETLENGTFDYLKNLYTKRLYLSGNRWNCNCSLKWLQDYSNNTSCVDTKKPPICFESGKKFDEVDFCPYSTSPDPLPESTSSVSDITTQSPVKKPEYVNITCRNQILSPIPVPQNALADVTHTIEVTIENQNINLQLQELDQQPLVVVLRTEAELSDYHLIWFNADNKNESGCITPVQDNIVLNNLARGTTYTFSLLFKEQTTVSPKCTFCIKTEPEYALRTWIPYKYQNAVIALIVCIVIFTICLTTFVTFLCIRRHPKIISSNKNVIIVKSKKNPEEPDVDPPREYEKPAYWEPYLVPSSHGYLTPKFHRYSKVRYRPPLLRSVSEWSVGSIANQAYSDPRHLRALKMLHQKSQNPNASMRVECYDEYPPPLPPPNPGSSREEMFRQLTQENLYSAI